jgi:hypothetical protein
VVVPAMMTRRSIPVWPATGKMARMERSRAEMRLGIVRRLGFMEGRFRVKEFM